MTPEELQAALDAANAELALLREENGQLLAAKDIAEQQAAVLQASWNTMQMQRNAKMDESALAGRLRDRWKKAMDDAQAVLDALPASPTLAQLRAARTNIVAIFTTARSDIALILAGG